MSEEPVGEDETWMSAILDFLPVSSSIQLQQNFDGSITPSISIGLRLFSGNNITTLDDRSLNDIQWSIEIYQGPTKNEHVKSLKAIGMLNYYEGNEDIDECCSAWAHIESDTFSLLSNFLMSGRLPSSVRIRAAGGGLRYGWEPDGSGKVWDIKPNKSPSITRLEISLGVGLQSEESELPAEVPRPVSSADIQNLELALSKTINDNLSKINSQIGWVLLGVATIAAITFFR